MLHEVLLALSGHPSPLFENGLNEKFPLVTPAENALLDSVARLASLHRALKSHVSSISAHHPSLICRAVATAISNIHLRAFQKHILEVEREILSKDASSVGAYDIVPLASVVSRFDGWKRRFEWFWDVACFIYPAGSVPLSRVGETSADALCTGAALMDRIRKDIQTGYPDIEAAALDLTGVAERIWLRQLSVWLVNGSVPRNAARDFFVFADRDRPLYIEFSIDRSLVPSFVTRDTARSILFVGKILNMLKSGQESDSLSKISGLSKAGERVLGQPRGAVAEHNEFAQELMSLEPPLAPAKLSSSITRIRTSLSAEIVEKMLPINRFMNTLALLRLFMLVGRGDFTDTLIQQADKHIAMRHQQTQVGSKTDVDGDLAGVMMRESEAAAVINKCWSAMAPSIDRGELLDEHLEWARDSLSLVLRKPMAQNPLSPSEGDGDDSFATLRHISACGLDEYLLLTPAAVTPRLDPAFDLFIGPLDLEAYSTIHSYLLAIRRGHNHVSDAWRQTPLRRIHPAPAKSKRSKQSTAFEIMRRKREKTAQRTDALRPVWASCFSTVCVLAELGEYFAGDVLASSWRAFHAWATKSDVRDNRDVHTQLDSLTLETGQGKDDISFHDPELLAQGHRQYLAAVAQNLLMSDERYMKIMRALLSHIDQVVAQIRRLEVAQRNVDLQDEGVIEGFKTNHSREEADVQEQLLSISQLLNDDLSRLLERLRQISTESTMFGRFRDPSTSFEPHYSGSGVERLLARLDAGVGGDGEGDGDDDR